MDIATRRRPQQAAPATRWPDADILIAKARCTNVLKGLEAVYVPLDPLREGDCGAPAPVQLMAVGKNPQVILSPPAVVTCDMVVALHGWLRNDVQPSARRLLGSPIVKIENMSSYSCRNAYGRSKSRLSEHGRANALDIRGFVSASGQDSELLADWGPTAREVRAVVVATAKAAATKAAGDHKITSEPGPPRETASISGGIGALAEGAPRLRGLISPPLKSEGPAKSTFAPQSQLGGPKAVTPPAPAGGELRQQFLREAHTSACRTFTTVLGPEANNAHRNHFHIDMAERSSGAFCE